MTSQTTATASEEDPALQARSSATIAAQNDLFRSSLGSTPQLTGTVVTTMGVITRDEIFHHKAMEAVRSFDRFDEDNDPHGEHDFGSIEIDGQTIFWKIDLYAPDLKPGSSHPSDPEHTHRVLTVMLASEY